MREVADKSVTQAQKAVGEFMNAAQTAAAAAGGKPGSPNEAAGDLSREMLAFAEENIAASFDLAKRLIQARTIEEMTALQQEFLGRQSAAVARQGADLGVMASRAARSAAEKKKPAK